MSESNSLKYYKHMLNIIGSLTGLFSESNVPYLNYRVTENLFCKAFSAKNLSRSDVSADASIKDVGIGIKTFINGNGKTLQKIAEFNKDNISFRGLPPQGVIKKVAHLRNQRIAATKRIYGLKSMIYHCIVRDATRIQVYECDMDLIYIKNIKSIKAGKNTINFNDSKNEYSFNISKSTLYKRFHTTKVITYVSVKIINDPFEVLEEKFMKVKEVYYKKKVKENPFVILPLYSITKDKKAVYPKSGLNQWNASGRKRDHNEIYIPIPKGIHKRYPGFFLPRDKQFNLILPDGNILQSKVCQDGSKALMTKHNADLGKWLLRNVLNLKENELLTYEKLQEIGLDSVIIERIDAKTYSIDFRPSGTYEKFIEDSQ
ncbi:MAG: NgoFVII family restriction endonuclease [Nanoarchaeota archaeon]|nr:NgoFVII family restriction endonuclease [Nanoarchaeota archaeon]MBU1322143.1 NgoFVII family restriction endonuclease [Nanoarchaeota archaeon]MBU1597864.1 NgoFVII family restriction endonuclease [Nanoarchaeota archaeon]MBU2441790.1 NgoFVII family restriction endonuclease [Nanoarchaeota archaeon]